MSVPEEDTSYHSRKGMLEDIMVMLGGRAAEELTMDDISTGASNDLQRATGMARQMVIKYGMSKSVGLVSYDSGNEVFLGRDLAQAKPYSEKTAADIDDEIKGILTEQYERTKQILSDNMPVLEKVANKLLEKETIDGEEFNACFED